MAKRNNRPPKGRYSNDPWIDLTRRVEEAIKTLPKATRGQWQKEYQIAKRSGDRRGLHALLRDIRVARTPAFNLRER